MASKSALLGTVPMFKLLDAEERTALATLLDDASFAKGQTIFEAGDPSGRMYVVCSGSVELSTMDKLGQKIVLTEAGPGDMFGELSLLDAGPRSATARVVEDTALLVLGRDELLHFLNQKPDAALDMMATMARRLRETDIKLRQMAVRNVNEEIEQKLTPVQRMTDWIAAFSGSIYFLGLHVVWFAIWIGLNIGVGGAPFDPFPFGLLTMIVSLEAIFLSVIVLLSQNRQASKDRIRSDIEYDVNLKAELEVTYLHQKVEHLHAAMLSRLGHIEDLLHRR
jgi:CRP/FNR family transcriptional regulator, cyclic AMP receptor protein